MVLGGRRGLGPSLSPLCPVLGWKRHVGGDQWKMEVRHPPYFQKDPHWGQLLCALLGHLMAFGAAISHQSLERKDSRSQRLELQP